MTSKIKGTRPAGGIKPYATNDNISNNQRVGADRLQNSHNLYKSFNYSALNKKESPVRYKRTLAAAKNNQLIYKTTELNGSHTGSKGLVSTLYEEKINRFQGQKNQRNYNIEPQQQ